MQRIERLWQMLLTPFQRKKELQGKQRHTMNPGMKNTLISMLYPTALIIAKDVLLIGTGAHIEVTMSTVGTTARTINIRLQGTICPGKTPAKNQCVTTVQVSMISLNAHNIKKIKISVHVQNNR